MRTNINKQQGAGIAEFASRNNTIGFDARLPPPSVIFGLIKTPISPATPAPCYWFADACSCLCSSCRGSQTAISRVSRRKNARRGLHASRRCTLAGFYYIETALFCVTDAKCSCLINYSRLCHGSRRRTRIGINSRPCTQSPISWTQLDSMREYRRPLTLGRLDSMRGKQRPTSRQRSSDIQSRGQARCWASVFFSVLAGAIICTPYLVLGPHVVFSVSLVGSPAGMPWV